MKNIGVFLSSKTKVPDSYHEAVKAVGEWIGTTGRVLVYGGTRMGLMEELAQSAKAAGATIIGIIPEIDERRNCVSKTLDVTIPTVDLSDRKSLLVAHSDVLVALPGGIGTVDEIVSNLSSIAIGYGGKPVVLLNLEGCWNTLLQLLKELESNGLMDKNIFEHLHVVNDPQTLFALIESMQ